MVLASLIRQRFNLPGPSVEVSRRLTNKALQRALWLNAKVPIPDFQVFFNDREAIHAIKTGSFPVMLKPADSSGSRGVVKLESNTDDINSAVTLAFEYSKSGCVIVEKFMAGVEFTVESFLRGGHHSVLAITEKKKVPGTRGTVASELATRSHHQGIFKKMGEVVGSAYRALGYLNGPGHAEVILRDDGSLGMVEVAGRGGGFGVFDSLVPAVSGIDIVRLTVMDAIGRDAGPTPEISKNTAGVLRFIPSRPGKVSVISGLAQVNEMEGVKAGVLVEIGDVLGQARADGDRMAWILATGNDPDAAMKRADSAEKLLTIRMSKERINGS
jgi:biotin carboxylase